MPYLIVNGAEAVVPGVQDATDGQDLEVTPPDPGYLKNNFATAKTGRLRHLLLKAITARSPTFCTVQERYTVSP